MEVNGKISFPFLNTMIRALRFQEQPEQDEQDIYVLTFED